MEVQIKEKKSKLPGSWNELPLRHQLACVELLTRMVNRFEGILDEHLVDAIKIDLVKILLNLEDDFFFLYEKQLIHQYGKELGRQTFLLAISKLVSGVAFFFSPVKEEKGTKNENAETKQKINLALTQCPYPYLSSPGIEKGKRKVRLFGPKDSLENISFYEMGFLFQTAENYILSKDPQLLDKLIAIMYRPHKPKTRWNIRRGYEGDFRLPLLKHEATIEKRQKLVATLPPQVKTLLFFFFLSCREKIVNQFQNLFQQPDGEKSGNDYGYAGILLRLGNGPVNMDKVAAQNHFSVLVHLSMLEDDRKRAERKNTTLF